MGLQAHWAFWMFMKLPRVNLLLLLLLLLLRLLTSTDVAAVVDLPSCLVGVELAINDLVPQHKQAVLAAWSC
jgi:hypothetical protein